MDIPSPSEFFMMINASVFYVFSALLLSASLMVVSTRRPVRAVLFLVLAFFAAGVLWMLLEAEFLALVLIFVYVGAVMTLFLFVAMMTNVDRMPQRSGLRYALPMGLLLAGIFVCLLLHRLLNGHFGLWHYPMPAPKPASYSHLSALGQVLYTDYVLSFEVVAVILLVAIIAAIGLTFRGRRATTKGQKVRHQLTANKRDRLRIVSMLSEKPL